MGVFLFILLGGVARMQGAPLQELKDPATFTALYYTPPKNQPQPLPLLLYLHGAGESGNEIRGLISEGATGTPPVELEHGTALLHAAPNTINFVLHETFLPVSCWTDSSLIRAEKTRRKLF